MGVALITPFKEDESVDYEALARLVDYQLQNGTDYLVVLGTTAETPTLTEEEKKDIPAEESLEEEVEIAPVQPTEEIPEEEGPEITEDEEEKKVCIAQAYILYNSTQYKPGDVLPANDPEMLAAWLEAGTAKWLDETVVNSMKAQSVTALAGMYGTAVSSDSEDGEDLSLIHI